MRSKQTNAGDGGHSVIAAQGPVVAATIPGTHTSKKARGGLTPHAITGQPRGAASRSPFNADDIVGQIIFHCRIRRWAMKSQQKLDRSLESFVRLNFTEWEPAAKTKERAKANAKVGAIINAARKGDTSDPIVAAVTEFVAQNDKAREPFDDARKTAEKNRERLCKLLPIAAWVKSDAHGIAIGGLADIIGEAGNLGSYDSYAKLWKRLGFAPYNGLAGSTWKRETWRPRAMMKDEWIANPFSGERYAIMRALADSMFRANGIGKERSGTGTWLPTHHYGFLYARRRDHTAITHDDWSDGHSHADALRYMFKKFLRDLWKAWRAANLRPPSADATVLSPPAMPASLEAHS